MSDPSLHVRKLALPSLILALAVAAVWVFPVFWYRPTVDASQFFWLAEQKKVDGWKFEEISVAESAERVLVADRMVNGYFTRGQTDVIRVFSAKRYQEKQNEIGLFVHTPDRCWTQAGWKIEPVAPDVVDLSLHGHAVRFERRLFVSPSGHKELVYFAGMVGGEVLPYRLDHNLSVAMRYQIGNLADESGTGARASDKRLWNRVWDSFASHKPLLGPKQFLRISCPVNDSTPQAGDELLKDFIGKWMLPGNFAEEAGAWKEGKPHGRG